MCDAKYKINDWNACKCPMQINIDQRHPYEVKRMYVRVSHNYKRKWVPIGWICPVCKSVSLDQNLEGLYGDYAKFKKDGNGIPNLTEKIGYTESEKEVI